MKIENKNVIFTQKNSRMIKLLSVIFILSAIVTILFLTVIPPVFIVLVLIPAFLLCTVPIFYFALKDKIIYRFTENELQYRGQKPAVIKWENIKDIKCENNIIITLQDKSIMELPYLDFNKEEICNVLKKYMAAK